MREKQNIFFQYNYTQRKKTPKRCNFLMPQPPCFFAIHFKFILFSFSLKEGTCNNFAYFHLFHFSLYYVYFWRAFIESFYFGFYVLSRLCSEVSLWIHKVDMKRFLVDRMVKIMTSLLSTSIKASQSDPHCSSEQFSA